MFRPLFMLLIFLHLAIPAIAGMPHMSSGEKLRTVTYAQRFLVGQGFDADKLQLRFEKVTPNLVYFNNPETQVFILVARERVAPLLHERTLAFSMGSTRAVGVDDRGFEDIFQYYDSTLTKMSKSQLEAEKKSPRFKSRKNVASLLRNIKWRQFRFPSHLQYAPAGSLTGCGPIAVAQLFKFYEYPSDSVNWSEIPPMYPYPTGDTLQIAPLLASIGKAAHAQYGQEGTSTTMEGLREALILQFGYSSRMYHAYHLVPEREMMRLVEEDLCQGRPSLMCGFDHIFICDGVCDDFFHLNMGWGGNYDGWYRFITPQSKSEQSSILDGVLVNVVPCDQSDSIVHDLNFDKPGGLAAVPVEQLQSMAHLKITGPLNGADLRVLRHMAGSMMNDTIRTWFGRLYDLDLSDARIVKDSVYFYDYLASEAYFMTSWRGKEYHFDHMTHRQWLEIADTPAAHNQWFDIVEEIPDSRYRIYLKTEDDVVGHSLFYSCQGLRFLRLPRSTQRIDRYAFFFCPMLEEVTMPDSSVTHYERESNLPENLKILYY